MKRQRTASRIGTRLVGALSMLLVGLFLWSQISVPFHLATHSHDGGFPQVASHGHTHAHAAAEDSRDLLAAWLRDGAAPPPTHVHPQAEDHGADDAPTPHDHKHRDHHTPHSALDHIAVLFAFATAANAPALPAPPEETAAPRAETVCIFSDSDAVCAASRGPPRA